MPRISFERREEKDAMPLPTTKEDTVIRLDAFETERLIAIFQDLVGPMSAEGTAFRASMLRGLMGGNHGISNQRRADVKFAERVLGCHVVAHQERWGKNSKGDFTCGCRPTNPIHVAREPNDDVLASFSTDDEAAIRTLDFIEVEEIQIRHHGSSSPHPLGKRWYCSVNLVEAKSVNGYWGTSFADAVIHGFLEAVDRGRLHNRAAG